MHCPNCGQVLSCGDRVEDVATYHDQLSCPGCGSKWEATYQRGVEDELLHICPVKE